MHSNILYLECIISNLNQLNTQVLALIELLIKIRKQVDLHHIKLYL